MCKLSPLLGLKCEVDRLRKGRQEESHDKAALDLLDIAGDAQAKASNPMRPNLFFRPNGASLGCIFLPTFLMRWCLSLGRQSSVVAIRHHINGNAVYNQSNPLLQQVVAGGLVLQGYCVCRLLRLKPRHIHPSLFQLPCGFFDFWREILIEKD